MSIFRHASAWTLRALALWAAIELSAGAYERGADATRMLVQISAHRAALGRLEARAHARQSEAAALEAHLAATTPAAFNVANPGEAASLMRGHLIELGAQGPIVEPAERAGPHALGEPAAFTARWREPRANAPLVLYGLAQRLPALGVRRLMFEVQGELVDVEAELTTALVAPTEASP